MSKKLKKNFGSVGRGLKDGSDKERRRPSVGSVTQSTKVSSITLEMLKEKERDQTILAIRLSRKRPAYQVKTRGKCQRVKSCNVNHSRSKQYVCKAGQIPMLSISV